MLYKDFIRINEEFQYSINLQYDLNKLTKVNGYIPTSSSIEILMQYLKNIYYDSKERATVLVGPYGKGKSHLLLTLLALISLKNGVADDKEGLSSANVINELLNKIMNIDSKAMKLSQELRKQNKWLVPIIINSNYHDLNQAFLIALNDALEREGLTDLTPHTYFESVLEIVRKWSEYPDAYNLFKEELIVYNLNITEFKNRIKRYDKKSYKIFEKIYPKIAYGMQFNPLINSDIVKLYEEINLKICETGNYSGMFIVFDEFSKFIESSVDTNASKDIKILQDFAELANRSGNNQIHIACITHKAVNDYVANLPQEKIDAWRAVEGRFKEIYFTSSSEQNYELISNAIKKDKRKFDIFLTDFKNKFNNNLEKYLEFGLFDDVYNFNEVIGKGCYPLNPISAYALPRVSEKVAQNERTLFTFLARDEKGSLLRFINNHNGTLEYLNIDWIYDYFEILFKKEVFNQGIHSIWLKVSTLLNKVDDLVEEKIIKAIAVIYIVNELDKLSPKDSVIQASLCLDKDIYNKAINSLLSKKILIRKKSNHFYEFLTLGSENINNNILVMKETKASRINVSKILNENYSLGYVLPKKYNDEYEMTRFFKNIFITIEELKEINNVNTLIRHYKADGVILNLVYYTEEDKEIAIKKIKEFKNDRVLVCIPNNYFTKYDDLREYEAIQYLKNDDTFKKENDLVEQELSIYELDIDETISQYIKCNFDLQYGNCKYFNRNGIVEEIKKPAHISKMISEICEKVFKGTPVINNELINKMNPSTQIVKARNKIIEYIFEEMDKSNKVQLKGNGPESTIYRVMIINKGLENNRVSHNDKNLNTVLHIIEEFICGSERGKKSFAELYSILCGEGYGLRFGIIPVYLAFIIKNYKEGIVIYDGDKEVPLTVETINSINNCPENHFVLLENGTNEKLSYIYALDDMFKNYKNIRQTGYNRFSNIISAMQNWIQSLPKYTREYQIIFTESETKNLDKKIINIRKELLKFDINPREFLFEKLRKKILREENYQKCIELIRGIKDELDNHLNKIKATLICRVKSVFDRNYSGELSTLLRYWYSNLSDNIKKYAYDSTTNGLLTYISSLSTYDDLTIIENIAKIVTGLNIEDWNDEVCLNFLEEISRIENLISNHKEEIAIDSTNSYQVRFNIDGQSVDKIFDLQEISPLGLTLLDEVSDIFEEYADSIDINEKRNILIEIMKKLM